MTIKKKIAITGANGYLGMQTIAAALERNIMIHAVIRRSEVIESIKKDGNEVFLVKNFEKNALEAAFKGCESVIHFANIVCGSKELFEAESGNKKLKKMLICQTLLDTIPAYTVLPGKGEYAVVN